MTNYTHTRTHTHTLSPTSGLEVKNVVNSPQHIFTFYVLLIAIDFVCQAMRSAFDDLLFCVGLDCNSTPAYH